MRTVHITKGSRIQTAYDGYLLVDSYNGSIVYCERYDWDDDGNEVLVDDDCRYTRKELADIMKEVDGYNHKVYWEDPDDE